MPALSDESVTNLIEKTLGPAFQKELERLKHIDKWWRWDHDKPHNPQKSTQEYKELLGRAQAPWLRLVVESLAQVLRVDGYRRADAPDDTAAWGYWQANNMDERQGAIHREAIAYGTSYATVLPGRDPLTREVQPVIRGVSPLRMMAFYADPTEDDWPTYAIRVSPKKFRDDDTNRRLAGQEGWVVRLMDSEYSYRVRCTNGFQEIEVGRSDQHGANVCPVVRYANQLDLQGRAVGEVEPYISVAGRIDQTAFDRLVVQRFASFNVRTVAGMALPRNADDEVDSAEAEKLRLKLSASDMLVAEDEDTTFGTLPASPLDGFIKAYEADIHTLAAVTQTPPNQLLGQIANLSAESLAALEASFARKAEDRKISFGESHEKTLRLAAQIDDDDDGAADVESQVRWRDMESRSLAQAADALGKLAQMLGVPAEVLWEKIPGWTQQDVERAKALSQGDQITQLLTQMVEGQSSPDGINPPS